ncbi:hypothetical protein V6N12_076348 [Hibiscus sabdariffa]|uniref:Uncharacterized protein n=1 Tax=Hibiscus sabdariffa TaxID=183260 RepID=A0ABR2D9J5_9ROSI
MLVVAKHKSECFIQQRGEINRNLVREFYAHLVTKDSQFIMICGVFVRSIGIASKNHFKPRGYPTKVGTAKPTSLTAQSLTPSDAIVPVSPTPNESSKTATPPESKEVPK